MLRTQTEDDRAGSQLQAGYRECDLGFDRCFAVPDEPKRRREPEARLSSSGCTQRYGVISRVADSLKTRHVRSPILKPGRAARLIRRSAARAGLTSNVKPRMRLQRDWLLRYGQLMTARIAYDVYRGTADRTLRLATMPGAGLPAHAKRKDWVLMPTGKSPVHSDADRDIAVQGYCFFQVVERE